MSTLRLPALLLCLAAIVACASPAAPTPPVGTPAVARPPQSTTVPSPAAVPALPRSPSPSPLPQAFGAPVTSPSPNVAGEATEVVRQAVADAAARAGVAPDAVRVARVEAREWPNSGLGCPRPGMAYTQVITPGYLIVLEAGGQTFEYHADRSRAELCQR